MEQNKLIICCGVNRSGSTWTYQVIKELLKDESYTDLSFIYASEANKITDALKQSKLPVVVKMHTYAPLLDSLEEMDYAKLIYSHRDVRDIILSISRKSKRSIDDTINMPFIKDSIESYSDWCKHSCFKPISYTTIRNEPSIAVMQIANHINLDISKEKGIEIAEKLSFKNQKKYIANMRSSLKGRFLAILQNFRLLNVARDKDSLLHYNHIQSGEVDEWKAVMSYKQAEEIYDKYSDWMMSFNYKK